MSHSETLSNQRHAFDESLGRLGCTLASGIYSLTPQRVNTQLTMATKTQLKALSKALSFDRPPFCSGTISPSPEGFYLYYGKRDPK